jgi:hypothetical protein
MARADAQYVERKWTMTRELIKIMGKFIDESKELLCTITLAKQLIAQLEGCEDIFVSIGAFGRAKLIESLPKETLDEIRMVLLEKTKILLKETETRFDTKTWNNLED